MDSFVELLAVPFHHLESVEGPIDLRNSPSSKPLALRSVLKDSGFVVDASFCKP